MSASEVIGLIGLLVAIQALLMVFYLKAIEKIQQRQRESVEQIIRNKSNIDNIHGAVIGALSELSAGQRIHSSLLVRMGYHCKLTSIEAISTELGDYDHSLEKNMQEVNLFSNDHAKQQAALQSLAQDYGDLKSLNLMESALKTAPEDVAADIAIDISDLRRRLETKLRSR